jgi:hypothetical protein
MDEVLDELVLTLAEIRRRHGIIEDLSKYSETEALHDKAELCIKRLREESAKLYEDCMSYGDYMDLTERI